MECLTPETTYKAKLRKHHQTRNCISLTIWPYDQNYLLYDFSDPSQCNIANDGKQPIIVSKQYGILAMIIKAVSVFIPKCKYHIVPWLLG